MFDELDKYKQNDHFFFNPMDKLGVVCNAPTDKAGIYVVNALKNGRVELIYIGRSGKVNDDGMLFIRKGGIKDGIVNGHQFGKSPRRISWPRQMTLENIEALDVYWYVTHNAEYVDCPRVLENELLQNYLEMHDHLPRWNNEL